MLALALPRTKCCILAYDFDGCIFLPAPRRYWRTCACPMNSRQHQHYAGYEQSAQDPHIFHKRSYLQTRGITSYDQAFRVLSPPPAGGPGRAHVVVPPSAKYCRAVSHQQDKCAPQQPHQHQLGNLPDAPIWLPAWISKPNQEEVEPHQASGMLNDRAGMAREPADRHTVVTLSSLPPQTVQGPAAKALAHD